MNPDRTSSDGRACAGVSPASALLEGEAHPAAPGGELAPARVTSDPVAPPEPLSFPHLMVDLETFDTRPSAIFFSLAGWAGAAMTSDEETGQPFFGIDLAAGPDRTIYVRPQQVPARRADECFACSRRRCNFRIYTDDLRFDEVACRDHQQALEVHADKTLGHALRRHLTSSSTLRRGPRRAV